MTMSIGTRVADQRGTGAGADAERMDELARAVEGVGEQPAAEAMIRGGDVAGEGGDAAPWVVR